ncbi:unnamed protein product [Dicrocoelium dendriticum]|nr:unnamed protein product [Dicrocoelium dendriticum]
MSSYKIRVVLEGSTKYRCGKKWKKRYCIMALSPDNSDAMHLYVTKCYDDFAPYRNDGCLTNANLPSMRNACDPSVHLGHGTGHPECVENEAQTHSDDSSLNFTGPLVNSASLSCSRAAESTSLGLSLASSLASRMNAPAPIDEITGFESGYHMDKESNIIVLTGAASVHIIALLSTDEMFLWADTMSQIMTDCRFRVTLRKTANGSKLPQGIQGSLHVQRWRLCFIGEPSAGCRFICYWRLDTVEKAYTMTLPMQQSSVSQTFDSPISRKPVGSDAPHRVSLGSVTSPSVSTPSRPKHVFVLEAKNTAGKGRGTNTFELDGGSINELITVIDQFMARRFCRNLDARDFPTRPKTTGSASSSLCVGSNNPLTFISKYSHPSLASSPGASDGCHSASPAQNVPSQTHSTGSSAHKSNPLTMPISYISRRCNSSVKFDSARTCDKPTLKSYSYPQRSIGATGNSNKCPQEDNSINEVDPGLVSQSVLKQFDTNCSHLCTGLSSSYGVTLTPSYMNISASTFLPTQRSRNPLLLDECTTSLRSLRDTWEEREDMISTNEETQVARVPAGLVISKRPSSFNTTGHLSSICPERPFTNTYTGASFPINSPCAPPVQDNMKDCASQGSVVNFHRPYRYRKRCNRSHFHIHGQKGPTFSNSICATDQQTSPRVHPDNFPNALIQHGVFTADEDLVDAELITSNFQNPQVHLRTTSNLAKSSEEAQCTQCASSKFRANCFCAWCCHLDQDHVGHLDHRVYRHRYQQYRMCVCPSYLSRSLSSNVLSSLGFLPASASYNPIPPSTPKSIVCASHPVGNSDASLVARTSASEFSSSSLTTKTLCSDRWKPIRRLFHRKHSKSHDSLHPHDQPPQSPDLRDKHPVSCSVTNAGLNLAPCSSELLPITRFHPAHKHCLCELDRIACPERWHTAISVREHRLLAILCPRHGSRSYCPWFLQRLLFNFSLLPHTRREGQSSSHMTMVKLPRSSVCHQVDTATSAVPGPSAFSTIRNVVGSKQKTKAKSIFGKGSTIKPKTTGVFKGTCRTSIRDPTVHQAEFAQTHTTVSSALANDSYRSTNMASSLRTPGVVNRNQRCAHCLCSSHFPDSGCRSQSALSLTSLPCSEPAISRTASSYFEPMLELGTRSFCSSVSSLLTFQSISGSSSMLSSCATGENPTKQSALVPSTPRTEAVNMGTRRCEDNLENAGKLPGCDTQETFASAPSSDILGSSSRRQLINHGAPELTENLYIDCSLSKPPPRCDAHYHICPKHHSPSGTSFVRRVSTTDPSSSSVDSPRVTIHNPPSVLKDSSNPARTHSKVPTNETPDSPRCCHSRVHAFHRSYQLSSNSQRAHTLPNTNVFRSESLHLMVPSCCEHAMVNGNTVYHAKIPHGDASKTCRQHGTTTFNRLLPRFQRKARGSNPRHNTSIGVRMSPTRSQLDRKLSCQSTCSTISSSLENEDNALLLDDDLPRELENFNYCNVLASQSSTVANLSSWDYQQTKKYEQQTLITAHPSANNATVGKVDLSQSIYVNLPLSSTDSVGHYSSYGSRSGRLLQHVLNAVHHHSATSHTASSPNSKVIALQIPGSSSLVGVLESHPHNQSLSRAGPSCKQPGQTICTHVPPNSKLYSFCSQNPDATCSASSHLSSNVGMSMNFDFSEIPAEVRDPSRNYAMVDLRPSPASSICANTELAISVAQNRQSNPADGITSADSSTGSTIGFSNSTSTGSDCASDAATLTSDIVGSCVPVSSSSEQPVHRGSSTLFTQAATSLETTRRRHSHSLSLATTDAPILNYVHVIASAAPLATSHSTRRDDESAVSDPIGCALPEHHADSLSSSSGLGGVASQSITPPLAATSSTSFGDVSTSRSMTSSATSGEGNSVDFGFHSYSPPEHENVAYTQIDFARTMALGEVRGDMEHQEHAVSGKTCISTLSGTPAAPAKMDRSISMRKTLSRPIRSIKRGHQKKSSSFLS